VACGGGLPAAHTCNLPPPTVQTQVLTALDADERRLFADRICALDRRIMPGASKLTWQSDPHSLDFFCREARKHCHLADGCVTGFKAGLARIDALCKSIAEGLLIDVEKKKLFEMGEFEAVQGRHHAKVRRLVRLLMHTGVFVRLPRTPECTSPRQSAPPPSPSGQAAAVGGLLRDPADAG
jgi:hypothetical protein